MELGGATEYFLEASSPLNVYVSLRSSHKSNADIVPIVLTCSFT